MRELARVQAEEVESLRQELQARVAAAQPARWNADPQEVQRALLKLVLTLVEFLRQLMERQAIARMEAETLSADETEAIGQALMKLEETIASLCQQFGLDMRELNLDLGPLGRLI